MREFEKWRAICATVGGEGEVLAWMVCQRGWRGWRAYIAGVGGVLT